MVLAFLKIEFAYVSIVISSPSLTASLFDPCDVILFILSFGFGFHWAQRALIKSNSKKSTFSYNQQEKSSFKVNFFLIG